MERRERASRVTFWGAPDGDDTPPPALPAALPPGTIRTRAGRCPECGTLTTATT